MTAVPLELTQFTITVPHPGYWRVTFDNPPINLMNAATAAELQEIVTVVENTDGLRVVVFDSANPDFYFARYDLSGGGLPTTPGPTGLPPFLDLTVRLSQAPVISIAEIAGRPGVSSTSHTGRMPGVPLIRCMLRASAQKRP